MAKSPKSEAKMVHLTKPCLLDFSKNLKQGRVSGVRNYAGIYSRLSFSSRKTNLTNFLAVKASARLC